MFLNGFYSLKSIFCVIPLALILGNSALASSQTDCFKEAQLASGADKESALEVCANAENILPAQCFRKAVIFGSVPPRIAAQLCYRALNLSPADCYRDAVIFNHLSPDEALKLCKPRWDERRIY